MKFKTRVRFDASAVHFGLPFARLTVKLKTRLFTFVTCIAL